MNNWRTCFFQRGLYIFIRWADRYHIYFIIFIIVVVLVLDISDVGQSVVIEIDVDTERIGGRNIRRFSLGRRDECLVIISVEILRVEIFFVTVIVVDDILDST